MHQDAASLGSRPLPRRLCVRWGPSPPRLKGGEAPSPIFGPFLLWPNGWMHQDSTSFGGRRQPRGDFVFDGDPALSPKRGQSPQFSAHVYCGQTAASIKMPLGTEVGLGPDDIVLYGDPATPLQKGGRALSPIFGRCLLCPNGWMDQDGT